MAFMRNINDFILTLVALSLPSIAATIDCNGKPFHCLNSTHFMICVDFGSGVSSTMDDFVIPCPPTTVCHATNRFECEFPTVTTATTTTNIPLAAPVNNDLVIDTVNDVTTIPFEEYFNTISTTTLFESNFITRDEATEIPLNYLSESFNVPATDETASDVGISPNYFTTLATLNIVTQEATVTERIPNENIILEPNSTVNEPFPNATEIIPTVVNLINVSENNNVDVTENYEYNSTLLETIIGATNFRQFNTSLYNSTSYYVTEPILSETTESIISITVNDKQAFLPTFDASSDVVLNIKEIDNVTESTPVKTTEYKDLIKSQSNSTFHKNITSGDYVQNNSKKLNTTLDSNGSALNMNSSDLFFNEIATKYEEQLSTAEPFLFEAKENTINIPIDDKQNYLTTIYASLDVNNKTIDNVTESISMDTTEYKYLIESQKTSILNETMTSGNNVHNDPRTLHGALNIDESTLNENTIKYEEQIGTEEPILFEITENIIINKPFNDKQPYLTTLNVSPDVVLDNKTTDNVMESTSVKTTEYKHLIESQSSSILNEAMPSGDIVENYNTTTDIIVLNTNVTSNVNNSDLTSNVSTTKYDEQISTAQKNFELSGNTVTESTQPNITERANITESKLTTTVNIQRVSTMNPSAAINTNAVGEVTEKLNVIESENKTTIFNDVNRTMFPVKDSNDNLTFTENFVTSTEDNISVKPDINRYTAQNVTLTSIHDLENVTETVLETEEKNLLLPKFRRSNKITTIVYSNHSTAENKSTTISNIDTIINKNKTNLNNISANIEEVFRVIMSDININDSTADTTENLLQPVTQLTNASHSNIAHNVLDTIGVLTNENPQETSRSINRMELTATGDISNEPWTQNISASDMNNDTEINVTLSNVIELNNRMSVSTADDQINTNDIAEITSNYNILETATQQVDSFTSNVYYQTDIEKISHDRGITRNNMIPIDTNESTSSLLVLTTEYPKETHYSTTTFISVNDNIIITENDTPLTVVTDSQHPASTPSTAFDNINSAVDTFKPVERESVVEEMSTESSQLKMTSAVSENPYVATEENKTKVYLTDTTNSPEQPTSTSIKAMFSAVDTSKQVNKEIVHEKISTEPSILNFYSTISETIYVATEQNLPSAQITLESFDSIPDRITYTNTTETANNSVHQESSITITTDSSTTKSLKSSAITDQNSHTIKDTLLATTISNTATDLSAKPHSTVTNVSGVTNFEQEINDIIIIDTLTTEKSVDTVNRSSTDNVLEKYPMTIKKEDTNISNSIKTNKTMEETINKDTKLLSANNIQRGNISKLEITSIVSDATTHATFITDPESDVNYNENQYMLTYSQDQVFSNAQTEQNIPEPFRTTVYDPNSLVNKVTLGDTTVTSDPQLTPDEIIQQTAKKSVIPIISSTEMLLDETLTETDVLLELKTNSESSVKPSKLNHDNYANPIITTTTSSLRSHTESKLSLTTSIQESTYQPNLASSTESWRATVVTKPAVQPTRVNTETLLTSSKPHTESNNHKSLDITSVTPKLNSEKPSETQYINHPHNMEPNGETKNILISLEPSVIIPQVTEASRLANHDVLSSSESKFTTSSQKPAQNQGVSTTEKHFMYVTSPTSRSIITKPVNLLTIQAFSAPSTQILPEHRVFNNNDQMEEPSTEKLKVSVQSILRPSAKDNKPLVETSILESSYKTSKDVILNTKTHLITDERSSNSNVELFIKPEFNKVPLNSNRTTEKNMTSTSDPDIVMVDVVKTDTENLGEIAIGSNNTHSGISAIPKSTSQEVEKHKASKSVTNDERKVEREEKPKATETNNTNVKIEHLTSTEVNRSMQKRIQANVQLNASSHTKQKSVPNLTYESKAVAPHVENSTVRYSTRGNHLAKTHNATLPALQKTKHNFVCKSNNRGRFSDNGDCRKFYVCIGKHEPIKGICPNNTVFSELRKQCTKNLSHCVRNNQFRCVSEGRFSDYLNDSIYYICVNNKSNRFIRFKFQCQNGYHLNKTSVRCVLNTQSILSTSQQSQQSASDLSTSNQSVSVKSERIIEKPETKKNFECKRSGKFPEPNDCRKYYVCKKLGKSEYRQRTKICDSDEVYNRDKKKCVDADSYECN